MRTLFLIIFCCFFIGCPDPYSLSKQTKTDKYLCGDKDSINQKSYELCIAKGGIPIVENYCRMIRCDFPPKK